VALDNVSRDFGGMKRSQIRRNAKPSSDDLKVNGLLDRDGKIRTQPAQHFCEQEWLQPRQKRKPRHDQCRGY